HGFGFGELVANVRRQGLLLLLKVLDLLNELAQLVLRRHLQRRHASLPPHKRSPPHPSRCAAAPSTVATLVASIIPFKPARGFVQSFLMPLFWLFATPVAVPT